MMHRMGPQRNYMRNRKRSYNSDWYQTKQTCISSEDEVELDNEEENDDGEEDDRGDREEKEEEDWSVCEEIEGDYLHQDARSPLANRM